MGMGIWLFGGFRVYARSFLCAGCGNGEGHVAPVYANLLGRVVFTKNSMVFCDFALQTCLASWWAPGVSGCLLGAPRRLLGGSWVLPGWLLGTSLVSRG